MTIVRLPPSSARGSRSTGRQSQQKRTNGLDYQSRAQHDGPWQTALGRRWQQTQFLLREPAHARIDQSGEHNNGNGQMGFESSDHDRTRRTQYARDPQRCDTCSLKRIHARNDATSSPFADPTLETMVTKWPRGFRIRMVCRRDAWVVLGNDKE